MPDTTNSYEKQFNQFTEVVSPDNFSDYYHDYFAPYVYQALTQNGVPGYKIDDLEDLISEIDFSAGGNPNFELLAPTGVSMTYSDATINDIYSWLQTSGNNIIYIYAANDPWSAGAIELTGQTKAVYVMQPGENHRVKINDLDNPDFVYSALDEWLDIEIQPALKSFEIATEEIKARLN